MCQCFPKLLNGFFVERGDLNHMVGLLAIPTIVETDAEGVRAASAIEQFRFQRLDAFLCV
jgi:hypothetical protein